MEQEQIRVNEDLLIENFEVDYGEEQQDDFCIKPLRVKREYTWDVDQVNNG